MEGQRSGKVRWEGGSLTYFSGQNVLAGHGPGQQGQGGSGPHADGFRKTMNLDEGE